MEFIEHYYQEYVNEGDDTNSMDKRQYSEYECVDPLQDNQKVSPNSFCYSNDNEPIDIRHETQKQKKFTEGLRVLSDIKLPAAVDLLHSDCKFGESFKLDDVLHKRLQTVSTTIEVYDSADEESDPLAHPLGDFGKELELSDIGTNMAMKCEVDIVKTIKTERERGQHLYQNVEEMHGNETLDANRSIIVLPKSPQPTTSYRTLCKPCQSSETSAHRTGRSSHLELSVLSKAECIMPTSKHQSSEDVIPPQSLSEPNRDIRISNVASIGKTSAIRLASPKKQSTMPETNIRPSIRAPFSKQPKKIVVKIKKPFVPVVEDANILPPERIEIKSESSAQITSQICEGDEKINHPFSPLRQSYTPPLNYLLHSKNRDSDEKEINAEDGTPTLVDLCTKESIVNVDIEEASNDANEPPISKMEINDGEMDRNDSKIGSCECGKEIFTIEFKDDEETKAEDTKILHIKIESCSEVNSKTNDREESLLPDSNESDLLTSQPTTSSQEQNKFNEAGPSRTDYGLSSFEDFYSSVQLSPIDYTPENYGWNQRFNPQYVPFDNEKNSYMDLDLHKNTNSFEEPSTESLNIRTDEKMPAKGEISEQESNGDVEGSSWSQAKSEFVYLDQRK